MITFTNKAADELRIRIQKAIYQRYTKVNQIDEKAYWHSQLEKLNSALIGTIHSFCLNALLQPFGYQQNIAKEVSVSAGIQRLREAIDIRLNQSIADAEPYASDFIYNMEDYRLHNLIRDILMEALNNGLDPKQLLEWTKSQSEDPGKNMRVAMMQLVQSAFIAYQKEKQLQQILDYQDIIQYAKQVMMEEPVNLAHILNQFEKRYSYLFVDEFQDTDRTQKFIFDKIFPRLKGMMVVGDNKQAIYGWRGGDASLINELCREHGILDKEGKPNPFKLNLQGRSTEKLLEVQNLLIKSIGKTWNELNDPLAKRPGSFNPTQVHLPVLVYIQAENGVKAVTEYVQGIVGLRQIELQKQASNIQIETDKVNISYKHIVLLARENAYVDSYTQAFEDAGIPTQKQGTTGFYRSSEILDTFRMLNLLLQFPDESALVMALETSYFHDVDLKREIHEKAQWRGGYSLMNKLKQNYATHFDNLLKLRNLSLSQSIPQILEQLYQFFKIRDCFNNDPSSLFRFEKLKEIARNFYNEQQALTLRPFVNYIRYAIEKNEDVSNAELVLSAEQLPDKVRAMTIHGSKGLEFPIVIIPEIHKPLYSADDNWKQNFLLTEPNSQQDEPGGLDLQLKIKGINLQSPRFSKNLIKYHEYGLEEEMRNFYVGLTRAEQTIILVGKGAEGKDIVSWEKELLKARPELEKLTRAPNIKKKAALFLKYENGKFTNL
ncbi:MAG: UvrD-helicase domain-containing protein [SAR324 cluster bacterium]|nr:UvrD-helicase domain-containing protein [SAR324 cluster bacterium]